MSDRYLRIVLTVIAIELGWIGLKGTATPVLAQQTAPPARVIISGIDVPSVPVRMISTVTIAADRPIRIEAARPLKVEADRPLPVENVHAPGARTPGE
jgi:hypothetical protein